jgi:hypothetical protein
MALPNHPDEDGSPRRPLPQELKFLTDLPDLNQMEDDELIAFVKQQHALIQQHAEVIRACGLDPAKLMAFTAPKAAEFEQATQAADAATEKMYHALADSADAQYKLFKAMEAYVAEHSAERPFDDDVQEAKAFVEEWRKQMPKE